MEESQEVQHAHPPWDARADFGLQVLDPSEREHVGLRIGPDLLGHRLEACDHVVQSDPLLDTILVAGQELSRQLGLLAWVVPASDRTCHRRRVEDSVSEGRHGFGRRTHERRSRRRLA